MPVNSKTEKAVKTGKMAKKTPAKFSLGKNEEKSVPSSFKNKDSSASLAGKKGNLTIAVYNQEGQEVEKISLPEDIFGVKINPDLIKQAYEAQISQSRVARAHTKDRGEVRGGGRKPWRQKGTGRARHGSIRSPIWRGGGVTFGPRKEKKFAKEINKKMRRKALLMVLTGKLRDKEIIILDDLKIEQPKTKLMAGLIKNLSNRLASLDSAASGDKTQLDKGALIVMAKKDVNIVRATKNLAKFMTIGVQSLNIVDLLKYKYLLMTKETITAIKKMFETKDR